MQLKNQKDCPAKMLFEKHCSKKLLSAGYRPTQETLVLYGSSFFFVHRKTGNWKYNSKLLKT